MTFTGDMLAVASTPIRTCAGCRARLPQGRLLRFARRPDGRVIPANVTRELGGRSTYLCPRRACLDQAIKRRAFARAFGTQQRRLSVLDVDADALWAASAEQLRREIDLLVRTARPLNPEPPSSHTHLRRRGLELLLSELTSQPQDPRPSARESLRSIPKTPREKGAPSHG
jgi:uncharacterized protein